MPSQTTLIWVGRRRGGVRRRRRGHWRAGLDAPGLRVAGSRRAPVEARAPEPAAPPAVPPAAPAAPRPPRRPRRAEPAEQAAAASAEAPSNAKPSFDVVTVQPTWRCCHRGPRGAQREGRAEGRRQDCRRGDRRRLRAICHDSSDLGAGRPQSLPGGGRRRGGAGNVQGGRRLRSPAGSQGRRCGSRAAARPSQARPRPPPLRCEPWRRRRRPTPPASPSSRSKATPRAGSSPEARPSRIRPCASISTAPRSPTPRRMSDGHWSLTIRRGMAPGAYAVRAEEVNPGGATVVASAEIRFDYPGGAGVRGRVRRARASSAAPQSSEPSSADAVLELDPDRAGRVRPHAMGAQSKLLRRPDALPADLRGQQGADP